MNKLANVSLNFKEVNALNKLAGSDTLSSEKEFMDILLDENLTVVQSEVTGVTSNEKVTYHMISVYSLTGIDYIVYKRISGNGTTIRRVYIGD